MALAAHRVDARPRLPQQMVDARLRRRSRRGDRDLPGPCVPAQPRLVDLHRHRNRTGRAERLVAGRPRLAADRAPAPSGGAERSKRQSPRLRLATGARYGTGRGPGVARRTPRARAQSAPERLGLELSGPARPLRGAGRESLLHGADLPAVYRGGECRLGKGSATHRVAPRLVRLRRAELARDPPRRDADPSARGIYRLSKRARSAPPQDGTPPDRPGAATLRRSARLELTRRNGGTRRRSDPSRRTEFCGDLDRRLRTGLGPRVSGA